MSIPRRMGAGLRVQYGSVLYMYVVPHGERCSLKAL